ncbi:hypothetical protein GCM10009759_17040 [Kitasatospora saccharophila]|uniref:Alpha/beta hydrolase family protein n=1 Tax=Kitasatospora saccharophila TaxID=407973 RepID=A0ABN2WGH7_9ACTN
MPVGDLGVAFTRGGADCRTTLPQAPGLSMADGTTGRARSVCPPHTPGRAPPAARRPARPAAAKAALPTERVPGTSHCSIIWSERLAAALA